MLGLRTLELALSQPQRSGARATSSACARFVCARLTRARAQLQEI